MLGDTLSTSATKSCLKRTPPDETVCPLILTSSSVVAGRVIAGVIHIKSPLSTTVPSEISPPKLQVAGSRSLRPRPFTDTNVPPLCGPWLG